MASSPSSTAGPGRIMVCGGAGFIGSHLVDRLVVEGNEVDVVDDLSSGSLSNLAAARSATGRLKFQNIPIGSEEFRSLVAMRRPDVIINVSSFCPSRIHLSGAVDALADVITVMESARSAGTTKVVTAVPASLIYGEMAAKDQPIKEGHAAEARTAEEILARAATDMHTVYRDRHGIESTVLALSNVYGARQRSEDGVVAAFLDALKHDRAPVVHGSGKQTRDFTHVDDVVDALMRARNKAGGLVVNVGTGTSTSVVDLWRMMAGASAVVPQSSAARPHDLARLALSPVRARIQLGWSPFTALSDGLARLR